MSLEQLDLGEAGTEPLVPGIALQQAAIGVGGLVQRALVEVQLGQGRRGEVRRGDRSGSGRRRWRRGLDRSGGGGRGSGSGGAAGTSTLAGEPAQAVPGASYGASSSNSITSAGGGSAASAVGSSGSTSASIGMESDGCQEREGTGGSKGRSSSNSSSASTSGIGASSAVAACAAGALGAAAAGSEAARRRGGLHLLLERLQALQHLLVARREGQRGLVALDRARHVSQPLQALGQLAAGQDVVGGALHDGLELAPRRRRTRRESSRARPSVMRAEG